MTMVINNASVQVIIKADAYNDADDLGNTNQILNMSKILRFTNGVGASQINQIYQDQKTLTSSQSFDLDLYGSLTNVFGDTINFDEIKMIWLYASDDNQDNIIIGGDATAAFVNWVGDATDTIVLLPGSGMLLETKDAGGYGVTATTADILQIVNNDSSNSSVIDIVIFGSDNP